MACSPVCKLSSFAILGVALLGCGVAFIFILGSVVKNEIDKKIPLKEGTDTFNAWVDPGKNADIYLQFFFFDVRNAYEVVNYGDKPILVEKGPYSYIERKVKQNITVHPNGTISYYEVRTMIFDPKTSKGRESDEITTLNIPIVGIIDLIANEYSFIKTIVEGVLIWFRDDSLFKTLTVKQLLWGYEDPLLRAIKEAVDRANVTFQNKTFSFDDRFGLFYGKNLSNDGLYTIYSGTTDVNKINTINNWNGLELLPYWKTRYANMINGTDGTLFHPHMKTSEVIQLFSTDICRSLNLTYEKDIEVKGITVHRFIPPPYLFGSVEQNPNNIGFCYPDRSYCLKAGVLRMSACQKGAPVIASQPHFYQGDESYINAVVGLNPNKENHETYLDVEPNTGVVMSAGKRIQLNVGVQNVSHIRDSRNIHGFLIFPLMWLNESALVTPKTASDFKDQVLVYFKIVDAVNYGLIVIGAFILLVTTMFAVKQYMNRKGEDDELTSPINPPTANHVNYDTM